MEYERVTSHYYEIQILDGSNVERSTSHYDLLHDDELLSRLNERAMRSKVCTLMSEPSYIIMEQEGGSGENTDTNNRK